jgi:hypothetical protein
MSDAYEMGRYVAVRPALIAALGGDVAAAVVWSLIRYRQNIDDFRDGWPVTYAELALWTGLGERRLRRVTAALRSSGWLEWERVSWAEATNIYTATVGPVVESRRGGGLAPPDEVAAAPGRSSRMDADEVAVSQADEVAASTTYQEEQEDKKKKRPHSDECRQACNLLADLIAANGSKRPAITDRWLTDMDRLHRIDGRSWEQIESAIQWSQDHNFWRANIMSPSTLRKQYDRLRLQYRAEHLPTRTTTTSKIAGATALINKMRGAEHDPRGITSTADRGQLHRSDAAPSA